ncbi:MAG: flippase-like domain-containing protein [Chloroflexi bacterium]|nr:flippase-like domain-containing protein [Chloroflexota bacterium]
MTRERPDAVPPGEGRPLLHGLVAVLRSPWMFQGMFVAALLALVYWQVDTGALAAAFRDASYPWLAVALGTYITARLVHAWEWQMTLSKVGRAPFGGLFGALLIGTLVNAVVPAAAGDAAKMQIVANRYGLSRAGLITGRGAEAVVNALIMMVFIVVSLALPQTGFASQRVLILLSLAALAAFVVAATLSNLLPRHPRWGILGRLPARARRLFDEHWPLFHDGLELIRRPQLLSLAIALNLFGWMVDLTILWAYGQAFQLHVPWGAYLSVTVAVAVITTFPITFGNVGTFEFALVRVLSVYGVPADHALAFAVGTHVFSTVFNIVLGLLAMWSMGLRPGEVFALRRPGRTADRVSPRADGIEVRL